MLSSSSLNLKERQEDLSSARKQQCVSGKRGIMYFHPSLLMKSSALVILEYPSSPTRNKTKISGSFNDYPTVGSDVISRETARMTQSFLPGGSIPLAEVSPFILHLLYQSCIILSDSSQEPRSEDAKSLIILQEALTVLAQRWLASRITSSLISNISSVTNMALEEYLHILAARKAMSEM